MKARGASRGQHPPPCPQPSSYCRPPPFTLPHPWRARLWERDAVFALGLRASFDTFLSLGWPRQVSAPAWASSPTPGHLGSMGRGRVPGPVEEVAACAETTRAGAGNTMSLGPHESPDMRVRSGDWQRSSRWCPRRHHCPPGSGAAEPSTPD